ncbi:type I-E CRISPR-associated protein Cse1/CasA [Streptomyces albidus (ex Kaewkla and Franco 2022)]|uniref:type I-E CRISPR-associated protein Cse1/CasA n=1 Tax=Streptomyces albidus (ex Kaewkla and Franco 2022) TaxID=722709 RepID=UPI0015EE6CDE|nr:type I-E CRISPR-associated protein Cse1/CasA [Streptomyces albidus (ex Kaewkla and Franco 2022)]
MDHQGHYPLTSKPWIGVRWRSDQHGQPAVGLRDLLVHSHRIAGLTVGPTPALSALYRILYALTARVTGLDEARKGRDDWLDRRNEVLDSGIEAQRVDDYLSSHAESFDLFGSRPFLQDPRLAQECPKTAGVNKLLFGRSAGNNHSWFGHHRDEAPHAPKASEAALHLLMWLYYGPSGRCGTRIVEQTSAADVSAGPLRSSLSFHPEGSSLLQTLLAGLVPPEISDRAETDLCPWELNELPDPLSAPESGSGPCSRLTSGWQHAVLLVPDAGGEMVTDAYVTWARRKKLPRADDAYLIWQTSQQGNLYPRPADSGRALWRDLDALLLTKPTGSTQPHRPPVLASTAELEEVLDQLAVRALGFEQDGKTKDVQYVSATTPAVLGGIEEREPHIAHSIGDLRKAGESYGARLTWATKKAWAEVTDTKAGDCAWADQAAALYWPEAERFFWRRLEDRDFDGSWREFRQLAVDVFERVTRAAPPTSRAVRAVENARLEIYGGRQRKKRPTPQPS